MTCPLAWDHIALHDGTIMATPDDFLGRQAVAGSDKLDYKRLQGLAARPDANPVVGEKLELVGAEQFSPQANRCQWVLDDLRNATVSLLSLPILGYLQAPAEWHQADPGRGTVWPKTPRPQPLLHVPP